MAKRAKQTEIATGNAYEHAKETKRLRSWSHKIGKFCHIRVYEIPPLAAGGSTSFGWGLGAHYEFGYRTFDEAESAAFEKIPDLIKQGYDEFKQLSSDRSVRISQNKKPK